MYYSLSELISTACKRVTEHADISVRDGEVRCVVILGYAGELVAKRYDPNCHMLEAGGYV